MGKHKTEREKLNQKLSKAESVEEKKKIYLEYLQFLKEHEKRWYEKISGGPHPEGLTSSTYTIEKQLRGKTQQPQFKPYKTIDKYRGDFPMYRVGFGPPEDSSAFFYAMFNRLHAKKSAIEEDQEKYEKHLHDLDHPEDAKSESELTTTSKLRTKAQAEKEYKERDRIQQELLREIVEASSGKTDLKKRSEDAASRLINKTKEKGLDKADKDDVLEYLNDIEKNLDAEENQIIEKDSTVVYDIKTAKKRLPARFAEDSGIGLNVPDKNDRIKKFEKYNPFLEEGMPDKAGNLEDGRAWNGFVLETRKRLKDIKALRKSLMETKFDLANRDTETYLDEDADKSFSDIDTNPDVSQLSNLTEEIKDDVSDLRDLEDLHAIKEQIKQSSGRNSPAQSRKNSFHEKLITPEDQEIYEKEKEALNQKAKKISLNINILEQSNNKKPQIAIQNKIRSLQNELLDINNKTKELDEKRSFLNKEDDLQQVVEQIKRSSAQVAHPTASRNQAIKEIRALSKSNLKNERRSSAEKNILSVDKQNPFIKKQQQEEKLRNAVSILDNRAVKNMRELPGTTLNRGGNRNSNIKILKGEIPVNEYSKAKNEILGKITEKTSPEQKVAIYEEFLDYIREYKSTKSPEIKAFLDEEANTIEQKIQEIEGIHDQDQAQAEFLAEEEGVPQEIIEQAILNNSQISPQKMTIRDKQKDLRDQIARINSREDLDNPIRQRSRRQSIQNILQQHPKQERSRSLSQSGIGLNALNKEAEAHDDIDDATDRKKQTMEDLYLKNEDINNKLAKYKHWHDVKKNATKRDRTLAELKATSGFEPKLNKPANMDDRNKEFQLIQHEQLVDAFRKLMDKDTEINKNERHAKKDPKIVAADKQIFSNQANIGDRKAIFKEQRDKLRGTYDQNTYKNLHEKLNSETVLKDYMNKLIIPAEENRVIQEIKKQNQKALKNAGFNITTTLLKNGMFLGPSKAALEAIAQEKVERRTNKDIQKYLAKDEVNRMNAALHQIEHDNKKLENMAKHAQSVEAQLSNEKRLNEAADYKDIQNLRAIGESDEARAQRELDLQNQEWYLEQERPKTKLKELAEIIHNKNGVPTYATPQLRMQLEKRDVIPSYNLGSNIVQGAARLMNYGNMDDDNNRQSRRRNASGGHIAQYAHGGSPMGTPDEYKLESYDPRNANTQEDSSFWDRLKANTKWTPENTRKWGAFMAGIDKSHSGIDESMANYYSNRDKEKEQQEALMFKIEESRQKQAQREAEFAAKQAKEDRRAARDDRKADQSDASLQLAKDKWEYDKEQDAKKASTSKDKPSSEDSALIKELQKKALGSRLSDFSLSKPLAIFDGTRSQAEKALKLINQGVKPSDALLIAQGHPVKSNAGVPTSALLAAARG